jgi:hypothetical protein
MVAETAVVVSIDWKSDFLSFVSERLEQNEKDYPMKSMDDIGSGGIESSNKFISNVRLKRSGAWRYQTNVSDILKLRCAKYNGIFNRILAEAKRKNKSVYSQKKLGELRLVVDNS